MFTDSVAVEFFTNKMILTKFHRDSVPSMVEEFRVSGYPTSVLINADGEEIDRIVGYMDPPDYIQTLVDYQNGIGTLGDLLGQAEDKEDRDLYFTIAEKYKHRGGTAEAREWFEKTIDLGDKTDSVSGDCRMALAYMTQRDEDYDEAIKAYEKIMEDFKGQWFASDAEIWTAICYGKKGDTATAIATYEAFIEHNPDSPDTAYAQEKIALLKAQPEEESVE